MTEAGSLTPPVGCEGLLTAWEGIPVQRLARDWGLPQLFICRSVGSTNDIAYDLARADAPAGTCVIADTQTAGRGRRGRVWDSPPGLGIWMSLILRPSGGPDSGAFPLAVGVAVARALEPYCEPAVPRVKWPNDVLIGDRKVAGVLCEASWEGERLAFFIAGIGCNVLHRDVDFGPALRDSATSLRLEAGREFRRAEIAGTVVRALLQAFTEPVLGEAMLAELRSRDALLGREIWISDSGGNTAWATAMGILSDGALRVRLHDGTLREVRSGTVRLRNPQAEKTSW